MYTLQQDFDLAYIASAYPTNSGNKYDYYLGLERGIKVLPDVVTYYTNGPFIVSLKFLNIFDKFRSTPFELNDVVLIPKYDETAINDDDFNSLKSMFNLSKKIFGRTIFTEPIYTYKLIEFVDFDLYDNYFLDYVDFKNSRFFIVRSIPDRIIKDLPNNFKIENRSDLKWFKEFRQQYKESYYIKWYKVVFINFSDLGLDIFLLPFNTIGWSHLFISEKFKKELERNKITGFEYSNESYGTEYFFT